MVSEVLVDFETEFMPVIEDDFDDDENIDKEIQKALEEQLSSPSFDSDDSDESDDSDGINSSRETIKRVDETESDKFNLNDKDPDIDKPEEANTEENFLDAGFVNGNIFAKTNGAMNGQLPSPYQNQNGGTELNPTNSIIHKQHCPQNGNELEFADDIFLASGNDIEKLKMLCEARKNQCERAEQEANNFRENQRTLVHRCQLLEIDAIEMKETIRKSEKTYTMCSEDLKYTQKRLKEMIDAYDDLKSKMLDLENQKTQLEEDLKHARDKAKSLSSCRNSVQKTNVDEIVRQLKDKHAKEKSELVSDLEGFRRDNSLLRNAKLELEKARKKSTAYSQTDKCLVDDWLETLYEEKQIEEEARREVLLGLQSESEAKSESSFKCPLCPQLRNRLEECGSSWEKEKSDMIKSYEDLLQEYREALAQLPMQIYEEWDKKQESLSLKRGNTDKEMKTVSTSTAPKTCNSGNSPMKLTMERKETQTSFVIKEPGKDEECSLSLVDTLMSSQGKSPEKSVMNSFQLVEPTQLKDAMVQTEDTLQTYEKLFLLLETWSEKIVFYKQQLESSDEMNKNLNIKFKMLNGHYMQLKKIAAVCQKEWAKKEGSYIGKIQELEQKYLNLLKNIEEKLQSIDCYSATI